MTASGSPPGTEGNLTFHAVVDFTDQSFSMQGLETNDVRLHYATPAAKVLVGSVHPAVLAGLLYCGAGMHHTHGQSDNTLRCVHLAA
jgi:hypothetical protein